MIELHLANSGNSLRAAIALEECGLPYKKHVLDLEAREHKRPDFLRLNPFGTVPVMVDPDGPEGAPITLSQSGLIMLYAAERSGLFLPRRKTDRLAAMQWFMAAVADAAPANAIMKYFGQNAPDPSEANRRYLEGRLLALLDSFEEQLGEKEFLLGEITVADLALFPIIHLRSELVAASDRFSSLLGWYDRLRTREAVRRAMVL